MELRYTVEHGWNALQDAPRALGFLGAAVHAYLEPKPPGAKDQRQAAAVYAGIGPPVLHKALMAASLICIGIALYLRWWP